MDSQALSNVIIVVISRFITALFLQLCWNASLPQLIDVSAITYWQSLAVIYLLFLAGHLFNNK